MPSPEQLLEISTEEYERMTDAELDAALGPAIAACQPLPGSEEEERRQKALEKEAKEQLELEELAAKNNGKVTIGENGKKVVVGEGGNIITLGKKTTRKSSSAKKNNAMEQMTELFKMLKQQGVGSEGVMAALPKELQFKKDK